MRCLLKSVLAISAISAIELFRIPAPCHAEPRRPEYAVYTLRADGKILGLMAADADGDGARDVFMLRTAGGTDAPEGAVVDVYLLRENRLPAVPDDSISLGDRVGTVEIGDINGDGLADVWVFQHGHVTGFLRKPNGGFAEEGVELLSYSSLLPASSKEPVFSHWIRDYNGDGAKDILLPGDSGLALFLGRAAGGFPQVPSRILQTDFESRITRAGDHVLISHRLPTVTLEDINGDDLDDLIAFDGAELCAFVARVGGTYAEAPKRFTFPAEETERSGSSSVLTDLNGDGFLDVVVLRFTQRRNIDSEIMIFLGASGFEFSDEPSQVIVREGQAIIPFFLDLNGDGQREMVLSEVKVSVGFFINYFLRHRIKVNVSVSSLGPDGRYHPAPEAKMALFVKTSDSANQPATGVGDFNGDGMRDFAVGLGPDRLAFFLGDGESFLSRGPAPQTEVDSSGTMTVLKINADESDDIFLRRSGSDEAGRATVLISK